MRYSIETWQRRYRHQRDNARRLRGKVRRRDRKIAALERQQQRLMAYIRTRMA